MSAKVRFYMFPGSNSVYTGRLMLEHKGVEYKTVKLPPAAHTFILLTLGFDTMGVPALKVDGRRVQGTRSISKFLDELVPERPLFPADPVARKAVEDAERWGEELQNATRRLFYCGARRDRAAFASVMTADRALPMRLMLRMSSRMIVRLATGAHRATDDAGREDLALLTERLDQIDLWIEDGLLNAEQLNAADFQIAPNIAALLLFDDIAPFIHGRPAEALAKRVAPDYVGHLGHVLPQEWLAPLHGDAPVDAAAAAVGSGRVEAKVAAIVRPGV